MPGTKFDPDNIVQIADLMDEGVAITGITDEMRAAAYAVVALRSGDEGDQWTRSVPRTEEELAQTRAQVAATDDYPGVGFTCDRCSRRYVCRLVFDIYNTDGDCLYSK